MHLRVKASGIAALLCNLSCLKRGGWLLTLFYSHLGTAFAERVCCSLSHKCCILVERQVQLFHCHVIAIYIILSFGRGGISNVMVLAVETFSDISK